MALREGAAWTVEVVALVAFGFLIEWLAPGPWDWVCRIASMVWFGSMLWTVRKQRRLERTNRTAAVEA